MKVKLKKTKAGLTSVFTPSNKKEPEEDLSSLVASIKKELGKHVKVCIANDEPDVQTYVSTGSLPLDLCIHSTGVPAEGKITELLGFFSSGKSLLLQKIIANAQRDYNAIAVLADRENAYEKRRGKQLGIQNDKLIYVSATDIPLVDDAFNFLSAAAVAAREKYPDRLIVLALDSIAAFDKVLKKGKGLVKARAKSDMGKKAKSIHEGMRMILNHLDKNTLFIFCNHLTYSPGIMFGDPRTPTGGEAPKFYPTVRLQLEQGRKMIDKKKGGEVIGQWIRCEVIKSKLDAAYRKCRIPYYYSKGIEYYGGYLRLLAERNIISPNSRKGETAFQTFEHAGKKFKEGEDERFIKEFPELLFDTYPEWGDLVEELEVGEEIDSFELEEEE